MKRGKLFGVYNTRTNKKVTQDVAAYMAHCELKRRPFLIQLESSQRDIP